MCGTDLQLVNKRRLQMFVFVLFNEGQTSLDFDFTRRHGRKYCLGRSRRRDCCLPCRLPPGERSG